MTSSSVTRALRDFIIETYEGVGLRFYTPKFLAQEVFTRKHADLVIAHLVATRRAIGVYYPLAACLTRDALEYDAQLSNGKTVSTKVARGIVAGGFEEGGHADPKRAYAIYIPKSGTDPLARAIRNRDAATGAGHVRKIGDQLGDSIRKGLEPGRANDELTRRSVEIQFMYPNEVKRISHGRRLLGGGDER